MSKYQLYNKSCEDMSEVQDGSVDFMVVDPPFNVGATFGDTKDSRSLAEFALFMERVAREAYRVAARDGVVKVNAADTTYVSGQYIDFARQLQDIYLAAGFYLVRRDIYLIKHDGGVAAPEDAGEWLDYVGIKNVHSSALHSLEFCKTPQLFRDDGRVLHFNFEAIPEHPCPFPEALSAHFSTCLRPTDKVLLELFMGRGRLGRYALRRNQKLKYIGYETDQKIFRSTEQRFDDLKDC